jgi:hypothetical protein
MMEYLTYFTIFYISFGLGIAVKSMDDNRGYMTSSELIMLFLFVTFTGVVLALIEIYDWLKEK